MSSDTVTMGEVIFKSARRKRGDDLNNDAPYLTSSSDNLTNLEF